MGRSSVRERVDATAHRFLQAVIDTVGRHGCDADGAILDSFAGMYAVTCTKFPDSKAFIIPYRLASTIR